MYGNKKILAMSWMNVAKSCGDLFYTPKSLPGCFCGNIWFTAKNTVDAKITSRFCFLLIRKNARRSVFTVRAYDFF